MAPQVFGLWILRQPYTQDPVIETVFPAGGLNERPDEEGIKTWGGQDHAILGEGDSHSLLVHESGA